MSKNQGMKVWYEGMVWYDLSGHTCILGMMEVVMSLWRHTTIIPRLSTPKKNYFLKYFECGII